MFLGYYNEKIDKDEGRNVKGIITQHNVEITLSLVTVTMTKIYLLMSAIALMCDANAVQRNKKIEKWMNQ